MQYVLMRNYYYVVNKIIILILLWQNPSNIGNGNVLVQCCWFNDLFQALTINSTASVPSPSLVALKLCGQIANVKLSIRGSWICRWLIVFSRSISTHLMPAAELFHSLASPAASSDSKACVRSSALLFSLALWIGTNPRNLFMVPHLGMFHTVLLMRSV